MNTAQTQLVVVLLAFVPFLFVFSAIGNVNLRTEAPKSSNSPVNNFFLILMRQVSKCPNQRPTRVILRNELVINGTNP